MLFPVTFNTNVSGILFVFLALQVPIHSIVARCQLGFFSFLSVLLSISVFAQTPPPAFDQLNVRQKCWVDSVFTNMAPDDRIAQLIMVAGYSNRNSVYEDSMVRLIQRHKVGGVVMFQGGTVRQAGLPNRLHVST